jgi:hypothetical protein
MKITRAEFDRAAEATGLEAERAAALWQCLEQSRTAPAFTGTNVLFYAGALIVIAAMTLYVGQHWATFSGNAIVGIGLAYGAVFLVAGEVLTRRTDALRIAGGLCVTVTLAMVPMITYGIQHDLGLWPGGEPGAYGEFTDYIRGGWFVMEVATLAVGALLLQRYRFPFLLFVLGVVLWFMSMDLAPLLHAGEDWWEIRREVSIVFGALMLIAAYGVDLRFRRDFAFWLYLFGMMTFWGGVTAASDSTEVARFLYCLLNVLLIALGVFLRRRVFMVFGVLGVMGYFGHLAFDLFAGSPWFPFALSGVGVVLLVVGYAVLKTRDRLRAWAEACIPPALQRLRPDRG